MNKICDICNTSMTSEEMTVVSSAKMKQAVRNGWHPPKDDISFLGSYAGIDSEELFFRQVMMDNSDWGLCTSCNKIFLSSMEKLIGNPQISSNNMVLVKGGTFEMGNIMGDKEFLDGHELPVHSVTLSDFMIGKYAVTSQEFDTFYNATSLAKSKNHDWGRGSNPVTNVSWYDAVAYCNWLSKREGLMEVYSFTQKESWLKKLFGGTKQSTNAIRGSIVTANWQANGYRLPTEAEWEYAARERGMTVRFGNGKEIANSREINFCGVFGDRTPYSEVGISRNRTVPVGSFPPNALGLYEMSGNVNEWCWDWYSDKYYGKNANSPDPRGPEMGTHRVVRGGSYRCSSTSCRASYRHFERPDGPDHFYETGFRLARH